MANSTLPSTLQQYPYNSSLSDTIPVSLSKEYIVYAAQEMSTKLWYPNQWGNGDIFTIQFRMRPPSTQSHVK